MSSQVEDEVVLFPGLDGIPFRSRNGQAPLLKSSDPLRAQPKIVTDMHVRQFDLSNVEEVKIVTQILDRCAKGQAYLSKQLEQYDSELKSWRMLLIWGEHFLEEPNEQQLNGQKTF